MTNAISYLTVPAENLVKSADFFRHVFDWEPSPGSNEKVLFYKQGGLTFALCRKNYFESLFEGDFEKTKTANGILLSVNLNNKDAVEATFHKAVASGAASKKRPHLTEWKSYAGFFEDPNGIVWEVSYTER